MTLQYVNSFQSVIFFERYYLLFSYFWLIVNKLIFSFLLNHFRFRDLLH